MTGPRTCLHFSVGHCTAQLCRWKDKIDPLVCTQGGILKADYLDPKNPKHYTSQYDPERRPL